MRTVVRARIDAKIKEEAVAVLDEIGLTASDAFRLMMVRIAAEKRLPFELLVPNEETVEAMRAARRGDLVSVGDIDGLTIDLNADDQRTAGSKRDHKRQKKGDFARTLDAGLDNVLTERVPLRKEGPAVQTAVLRIVLPGIGMRVIHRQSGTFRETTADTRRLPRVPTTVSGRRRSRQVRRRQNIANTMAGARRIRSGEPIGQGAVDCRQAAGGAKNRIERQPDSPAA